MAEVLGNLTWVILGLIGTVILGWRVVRYVRPEKAENQKGAEILAGGDS
jgi:hypothetical protein